MIFAIVAGTTLSVACLVFMTPFGSRQQPWLRERPGILRFPFIAGVVITGFAPALVGFAAIGLAGGKYIPDLLGDLTLAAVVAFYIAFFSLGRGWTIIATRLAMFVAIIAAITYLMKIR